MDGYINLRLNENAEIYRNSLERIVEKYSNVDGSGVEVCLQSMTCQTAVGIVPWDSVHTEKRLKLLKVDQSWMSAQERGKGSTGNAQMEVSRRCDELLVSMDTSVGTCAESVLWDSRVNSSQLLSSSMSDSCCSQQGAPTQPEEHDEELERTLSSQGSTLLDLYPGMLSQMGEACRRQQVAEAGDAVLRRYRRGWFARAHKPALANRSGRGHHSAYVMDNSAPSCQQNVPPSLLHVSQRLSSFSPHRHVVKISVSSPPSPEQAAFGVQVNSCGSRKRGQTPPQRNSTPVWGSDSEGASVAVSPPHHSEGLPLNTGLLVTGDPRSKAAPRSTPTRAPPCLDVCLPTPSRQVHTSSLLFNFQLGDRAMRQWIDQEFQKLYHRMLGGKRPVPHVSATVATPPRWSRRPQPPSSSLAALALSPAGSWARKRIREKSPEPLPGSKRFRWGVPGGHPADRHHDSNVGLVLPGSPGTYPCSPRKAHRLRIPDVDASTKTTFYSGFPSQRDECTILTDISGISTDTNSSLSPISLKQKAGSHSLSRKRLLYPNTSPKAWI
ncbi:uncharacterized protein si:dkeyp-117h8.4 [Brienomyrus brachyistius]|uniref:uncharacterized protein si:dkeyp-117h8.4 n=1 Tax=Brienomyrus brachyistius TaxID=42636 RepID=UPI0020B3575E|nr:uncharacterized protein si:dkeyp-117h8.4 [Brienomyrus brachyistius]